MQEPTFLSERAWWRRCALARKHGEWGSVEEEVSRKWLNMASEDNNAKFSDEKSSEVKDPSNLELKEMLVDIRYNYLT